MAITNNVTGASLPSIVDCCGDCETPVILSDLFEGESLIPFDLNMADGTTVDEIHSGSTCQILDGRGVMEIPPMKAFQLIELKVNTEKCQALSCQYVVSPKTNCATCPEIQYCDVKIKNLNFGIVGEIYGSIINLEVESYSEVEYQITDKDTGVSSTWTSNWREIPLFELNNHHTLTLRSGDCSTHTNIYVERKIINVPTTVYQNVPVMTPVTVNVPTSLTVPTPTAVYVGVPNLVPTPVAVLVNVPTIVLVPNAISTPLAVPTPVNVAVPTGVPTAVPTICPTPV